IRVYPDVVGAGRDFVDPQGGPVLTDPKRNTRRQPAGVLRRQRIEIQRALTDIGAVDLLPGQVYRIEPQVVEFESRRTITFLPGESELPSAHVGRVADRDSGPQARI